MIDKMQILLQMNWITLLILGVIAISAVLGYARGASASAGQLFQLVTFGAITLAAVLIAWRLTNWLSPMFHTWLVERSIVIPSEKLHPLKQIYYTFVTGLRDFSLLRFACVFMSVYFAVKSLLIFIFNRVVWTLASVWLKESANQKKTFSSGVIGAGIGSMLGAARAIVVIALLFVYATLQPQSPLTQYAQDSLLYQQGAEQIIAPISGPFIAAQAPVFTRAVEQELRSILQRRYEIIDQHIPDDIAGAAAEITKGLESDKDKAYALYEWVGSRIQYNHEKVRLYEEENIWLEQSPEDTFRSRKGVCIDYSRLYAVMARSVNLDVKVITGLGYDGRGGYGPHAWNEVYLSEQKQWVPLDSTWASSGNWFNPPNFDETHIKDA